MPIISDIMVKQTAPVNRNTIGAFSMSVRNTYSKNTITNFHSQTQYNIQHTNTANQAPVNRTPVNKLGKIVKRGEKISLENLHNINVCVGWELKNMACDVDISAFMLDNSRRIISDDWFVFYGQPDSPDKSIHLNCNMTNNDNKVISVNLQSVRQDVARIVFVLTIDQAVEKHLNFSMIKDTYIRITDGNVEILRFMLTDYYDTVTSMMLGELYRHNGQWKFTAIGDGVKKDLAGLCAMYGVETE